MGDEMVSVSIHELKKMLPPALVDHIHNQEKLVRTLEAELAVEREKVAALEKKSAWNEAAADGGIAYWKEGEAEITHLREALEKMRAYIATREVHCSGYDDCDCFACELEPRND